MRKMLYLLITATFLMISQYGMGQPRAVDLGLSVKWASCNLGANAPSEYGDYYAWGETTSKSNYDWSTYKWCTGSGDTITKYKENDSLIIVNNETVLDSGDDAAHVKLGGKWRMPTDAEWTELRTECTWIWTRQGGKNGYKVTSKSNGNSIFLPASGNRLNASLFDTGSGGYYWSSSLSTDNPSFAWIVLFDSDGVSRDSYYRCGGFSVRPVSE